MFFDNVDDKRVFPRQRLQDPARFEVKNGEVISGCQARDISEGGVRLNFSDFIPLGTELQLSVQVRPEEVVEGTGKVVWVSQIPFSEKYQIGVKFIQNQTYLTTKQRVQEFISSVR